MSSEENKACQRRLVEEIINKGNMAVAPEVVAEDFVERDPFPGQEQLLCSNVFQWLLFQEDPELFDIAGKIGWCVLGISPFLQVRIIRSERFQHGLLRSWRLDRHGDGGNESLVGFPLKQW